MLKMFIVKRQANNNKIKDVINNPISMCEFEL